MDLVVSTSAVVPASVVVPLAGAALMAGFSWLLPRWARDLIAIAVALATTTLTLILIAASAGHPMIYWFSGWRPSGGMVIGIDYAVCPLGAGMASLAGLLTSAALVTITTHSAWPLRCAHRFSYSSGVYPCTSRAAPSCTSYVSI